MKTITIHVDTERNTYLVLVGDRIADRLTFDEALGLVATELMPGKTRIREWLKTPEEWRDRERARAERVKAEVMEGVGPDGRQDELRTVEVPVVDSAKLGLFEQHRAALDDAIGSTFGISTLYLSKGEAAKPTAQSSRQLPDGWTCSTIFEVMPSPNPLTGSHYVEKVTVRSPSGVRTECRDDEDRYAKLLADRDELLAQLKAVEAARDAERLDRLGLTMRVTELQAAQHEPAVERWVVSEIDVDEEDRSYYDLHVGDVWTRIPGTLMLGRSSAKGSLTARFPPDGTAFAPFSCSCGVKFVADVTGAEPAPEPERAPEIIKQVELPPTRDPDEDRLERLTRRAEALGDAMLAARYGNQDGRFSREDLEELHAECLLDARIALGLERKGG